jgi:hypothetical protein
VPFVHLATGLTDLIELAARSSVLDMSMDGDGNSTVCGSENGDGLFGSRPCSAVKAPRRGARSSAASVTSSGGAGKARRPSRAAATAAASRLSAASASASAADDEEEEEEELSGVLSGDEEDDEEDDDEEEEDSGVSLVDNTTMTPTKQFILTVRSPVADKVKAKRVAKKISFQVQDQDSPSHADADVAAEDEAKVKTSSSSKSTRRGGGRSTGATADENAIPNNC